MSTVSLWNQSDRKNKSGPTLRKTHLSATLSTTDSMWTGLNLNLGLHSERTVTECLNNCTAVTFMKEGFGYVRYFASSPSSWSALMAAPLQL